MKKLALLLAMILALTPMIVACKEEVNTNKVDVEQIIDNTGNTNNNESVTGLQNNGEYSLNNLELDFGGKKFGIFIDKGGAGYLISEEEEGDLVGDAVFKRNSTIEQKFNLKFNMVEADVNQPSEEIKNYILADDKTYHMYINVQHNQMPEMILDGYFVDWNNLEHLDYTKPYWNSRIASDINFGGKVYTMGGDLNLRTYNSTNCIMFNKTLFDDLGIDYPYQDVYNMSWTIDKFIEIVKQGYRDLNGNTKIDRAEDRMGYAGWAPEVLTAIYIGMGGNPVVSDDDGLPTLNLNNDKTIQIVDKIVEIFDGQNAYVETSDYNSQKNMFSEGRLLMDDRFLTSLSLNRDSEFEYGVVPYPMLDEEQGEYRSRAANIAHLCYIPTTNTQLEETGIILEGMSIESYNSIRPVYYDVTLSLKEAKDEETLDMVDTILDSSTYIVEGYIGSKDFLNWAQNKFNSFSSWYASNERSLNEKLQTMRAFYSK